MLAVPHPPYALLQVVIAHRPLPSTRSIRDPNRRPPLIRTLMQILIHTSNLLLVSMALGSRATAPIQIIAREDFRHRIVLIRNYQTNHSPATRMEVKPWKPIMRTTVLMGSPWHQLMALFL